MWRSQVAHLLWEQGVGSSNLPIPTSKSCGDLWSRRHTRMNEQIDRVTDLFDRY